MRFCCVIYLECSVPLLKRSAEKNRKKDIDWLEKCSDHCCSWTGPMLGDMVQVLLRADWYKQALEVMSAIDKRQHQILGLPTVHTFVALLDKSIQEKDTKNGMVSFKCLLLKCDSTDIPIL